MAKKKSNKNSLRLFLDPKLINDFREIINQTEIFEIDEAHKSRWSLVCAVMDRIQNCVEYLNKLTNDKFDTEEEFVNFLTYCSIVKDAIIELFKQAQIEYPYEKSKNFLSDIYNKFITEYIRHRPKFSPLEETPTDDKFFEFLRSLAFAHPLETSRAKFIDKGETLHSPNVMINKSFPHEKENAVGLKIYSNKTEYIINFWFSLDSIKKYINARYELIKDAIKWANKTIDEFQTEWKKRKVNRTLPPLEILKDISVILKSRSEETYEIESAINLLKCQVTCIENEAAVKAYKDNIIAHIPELCDWIDNLEIDIDSPAFFKEVSGYPKKLHPEANYQLEKIFFYLTDEKIDYNCYIEKRNFYMKNFDDSEMDNFEWGLLQADFFFSEFGNTHVKFDMQQITSTTEIKLLVNTALYLEREKQAKGQVSECILQSQRDKQKLLGKNGT